MLGSDVADQLLNQYGLTHSGTAEEADLSALLIWAEQVNHLDTRLQNLRLRGLVCECRCLPVYRIPLHIVRHGFIIDRLPQYIKDSSQSHLTYRNRNGTSGSHSLRSPHETIGWTHGDAAHHIISKMLGNLSNQLASFMGNLNRIIDLGENPLAELDIKDGTDNLGNFTCILCCHLLTPLKI